MRRLSSIILLLLVALMGFAQKSPHGDSFKVSCADCHDEEGWKVNLQSLAFNHNETNFPLVGQHVDVSCRQCHLTLEFAKASKECNDCHTDMHNQTVGTDCGRCHTPVSWVVNDITGMHQRSRFPLLGAHVTADCYDCHTNAKSNFLLFGPMPVLCFDCHQQDYNSTTSPNHVQGGYSTNCTECHNINSFSWTGAGINHNFFPLTLGHSGVSCAQCHKTPDYSSTSPECFTCHEQDFNSTNNPNHASLGFSTSCSQCHSTNPGWKPAEYRDHDAKSFPIYSGEHAGEWNSCSDCHPNPSNYADFTCISCHEHNQGDMDEKHNGVTGYSYSSPACLDCHPDGSGEGIDHSLIYPLTGAHSSVVCAECHVSGYSNTPNQCAGCHQPQYNQSLNPNHSQLVLSTDCQTCHTTEPGWKPAAFPDHNNYYLIEGAHVQISNNCDDCHQGNYNTTPNTCDGCHISNYNQTINPPHQAAQFPITCLDCHNQTAWSPANWDHDNQYFPIYSGKHQGEWNSCTECHNNPGNYAVFTCIDCHEHNQTEMNSEHQGIQGYAYNSEACFSCHPKGSGDQLFLTPRRHE